LAAAAKGGNKKQKSLMGGAFGSAEAEVDSAEQAL
jgi:hypothetical protein